MQLVASNDLLSHFGALTRIVLAVFVFYLEHVTTTRTFEVRAAHDLVVVGLLLRIRMSDTEKCDP